MARKKNIVGDLDVKGVTYTCSRWQVWPPREYFLFEERPSADAREEMTIDQYTRLHLWEMVCGLQKMEERKCLLCPHVRVDGRPLAPPAPSKNTAIVARRHRKKNW